MAQGSEVKRGGAVKICSLGVRRSGKVEGTRRKIQAGILLMLSVALLCMVLTRRRNGRVEMTGAMGNDAGPSSGREGSDGISYPAWAANRRMRDEMNFHVGAPGWGDGPDYYSTERWDNSPVYPSNAHSTFDPYVGKAACPNCQSEAPDTRELSCTPRCDYSVSTKNIRNILKLDTWWDSSEFTTARYKENHWIGTQVQHFVTSNPRSVIVVPPCFFPRLAKAEIRALNTALYQIGVSLLVVGGLTGANFISQNLAGTDGFGYVDSGGAGIDFSPRYDIDTVFSEGPFYMQNSATTTEFFYGPKMLEGFSTTIGVPARQLPPDTVHYYMSQDEISVVFEIPASAGRIRYDYLDMAPHWIDVLMLAERELQIEFKERSLPWLKESRGNGQHDMLKPARGSATLQLHSSAPPPVLKSSPWTSAAVAGTSTEKIAAPLVSGKMSSVEDTKPAVQGGSQAAAASSSGGQLSHDDYIEQQIRKAMRELNTQRCPPGNNFHQCGPEQREYGPDPDDAMPTFKATRSPHGQVLAQVGRKRWGGLPKAGTGGRSWSSSKIRKEIKGLSLHDFDLTDRNSWEY